MQRQGVWVVVALLLGLGAGYFVGRGAAPEPALEPVADVDAPPAARAEPAPELRSAPAPVTDASATPTEPRLETEGRGVISGTVRDPEGQPLGGVVVIAQPFHADPFWVARPGAPPPPLRTPEVAARAAADRARTQGLASRRVPTDEDGTYRLERLGPGPFTVTAWKVGYRFVAGGEKRGWQIRPDAVVDFTSRAIATLHLELESPDGAPVDEAYVTAHGVNGGPGGGREMWTATRRWIEVAPGTFDIEAVSDGLKSARERVTIEHGRSAHVRLFLAGRPGIRGAIRIAEPLHRRRPVVHALSLDVEDPPTPEGLFNRRLRRGRERPPRARVARDGASYVFEDLAPGRWLVGLSLDGRTCVAHADVVVREDRAEHDFEIPPYDRAEWIRVHVLDGHGKPIRGATVGHGYTAPNAHIGAMWGLSLADGSYVVKRKLELPGPLAARGVPQGGTHFLRVSARDLGEKRIEFDPQHRGDFTITLGAVTSPTVRVVGAAALPAGMQVGLTDKHGTLGLGPPAGHVELPSTGTFEPKALQPGQLLFVAAYMPELIALGGERKPTYEHTFQLIVPVEVREGDREIRIELPVLRRLTVKNTKGAPLELIATGGAQERPQHFTRGGGTEDPGDVVLSFVPEGSYVVSVFDVTTRTKTRYPVTVSGGDAVLDLATAKAR